jgi:hypothetical protein
LTVQACPGELVFVVSFGIPSSSASFCGGI